MSVYFVYRSHYATPSLNHLKKFDCGSVLEWFQKYWNAGAGCADYKDFVRNLLGCPVYGFDSLFAAISNKRLNPPKSISELQSRLQENLYSEGGILVTEHSIQVQTDDDELEVAYYFFDDHFLPTNLGKICFLLLNEWRLPTTYSADGTVIEEPCVRIEPSGGGVGTVYCALLSYYDSGNLLDADYAYSIDGIRLPDLVTYLSETELDCESAWPFELRFLRSQLTERDPKTDTDSLREALEFTGRYPIAEITNQINWSEFGTGSPAQANEQLQSLVKKLEVNLEGRELSTVQLDEHVAQVSINTDEWSGVKLYQRWIFFDDLWAGSNADLASSILRYAGRWDVLF